MFYIAKKEDIFHSKSSVKKDSCKGESRKERNQKGLTFFFSLGFGIGLFPKNTKYFTSISLLYMYSKTAFFGGLVEYQTLGLFHLHPPLYGNSVY